MMRNKLLLICLFTLWLGNCFGQFTKDLYKSNILKGKIDSVVTTISFAHDSTNHDPFYLIQRIAEIYNNNKKLLESQTSSFQPRPDIGVDKRPVKTIYIYDADGNLAESKRYYTTGELWVKEVYSKNGLTVVAQEYDYPDNKMNHTDKITIDSSGKIIEIDSYNKNMILFSKSYFAYDGSGKLIKEDTHYEDGSLMSDRSNKYNSDGDIVEYTDPFGYRKAVHTYTYEKYDKMHNWLKQTEYIDNEPYMVRERVIVYY
jgi:hypothetical protein